MNLTTERLILRPWKENDAESLFKYASDPAVGPIAGWPVHTDVENSREIIKNVFSFTNIYALVLKDTNEPIGSIGLMTSEVSDLPKKEDEAEIGYWLGKPFWGNGLMTEALHKIIDYAFEELNLNVLWCAYYDGNEKSKRVQEKCSFKHHHTTLNKKCELMNDIRDEHVNILTKEDYFK